MLGSILSVDLISSSIRMATPLLFAALGGAFVGSTGIVNIALEGCMLIGSFFAVLVGYWCQSLALGLLASGISGMLLSAILAYLIIYLKTEPIVVGIGGNLLAWGITVFILEEFLHMRGSFTGGPVPYFSPIEIAFVRTVPVLGKILSGHTVMVYLAWVLTGAAWLILFKTPLGLRMRAIGESEATAISVGVNVERVRVVSFLVSGFLSGLGGAYLSTANLHGIWSENMTVGRGFIALCAVSFGRNDPKWILLACLLFGFADALGIRFQVLQWQPEFVLMIPYLFTIVVLWLSTKTRVL